MVENVYNITLDIDKGTPLINYPVTIRKGEGTSNVIRVKLLNHGVVLKMSDTDKVTFNCLKPDKHVVLKDPATIIDVAEGIAEYKISTQVGASAGRIELAYFEVGDYYTSNNFTIDVKENVDSSLDSSDYIPVLDELLKIWQDQIETIQLKLKEVKEWADNEQNEIAKTLDGYLKGLTASTDKWISEFEDKYTKDFDSLMGEFRNDYSTWKQGIETELDTIVKNVPELEQKLKDIKAEIDNLDIKGLTDKISQIEKDIQSMSDSLYSKVDQSDFLKVEKELREQIQKQQNIIDSSRWTSWISLNILNGFKDYAFGVGLKYRYKDELTIDNKIYRTVSFVGELTNSKNGVPNGSVLAKVPSEILPTYKVNKSCGASGISTIQYDIDNKTAEFIVHGTNLASTVKNPWMPIYFEYGFEVEAIKDAVS